MSTVDLRRYLAALWKWLWLLAITVGLAAAGGYYSMSDVPPTYVSSTTILVGEALRNPNPGGGDFSAAQQLADTYAQMAQRQPILDATVKALDLPIGWAELRRGVAVVHEWGSQIIELRVVDTSPERARDIADTMAQQLIAASPTEKQRQEMEVRRQFIRGEMDALQLKIQRAKGELESKQSALEKETSARGVLDRQDDIRAIELNVSGWRAIYASLLATYDGGGSPNTLTVLEPASLPTAPSGPNLWWNVALAGLAGLILATGGVLLIEYLDDAAKTKSDLEGILGVPTLGLIPRVPHLRTGPSHLLAAGQADSPAAEAFRLLAANLRFACLGQPGTSLLVTSAVPCEGKSLTAANLAIALAQGGKKVLLVDLDLHAPSLHTYFGASNDVGVTSLLLNPELRPVNCIISTSQPQLKVLCAGPVPPNPAELLSRFGEQLFQAFRQIGADFVIVDSPPVLAVADTVILAALLNGTLLVTRAASTRRGVVRKARAVLERTRAPMLGAVLNAAPTREVGMYGYRYRGQHSGRLSGVSAHVRRILGFRPHLPRLGQGRPLEFRAGLHSIKDQARHPS